MQKHAYCIIAHNNPLLLSALIEMIDDVRNDIFLLIDLKSDIQIFHNIKTTKSNIYYTPRIDIRWGDISQVKAEFTIFKYAHSKGEYSYYHLLSGVDMPLKSQDYIHNFFNRNAGKEFVNIPLDQANLNDVKRKTSYRYVLLKYKKHKYFFVRLSTHIIREIYLTIQKIFKFDYSNGIEYRKGANWVSITNKFCEYLLSKEEWAYQNLSHVFCPDEIFLQTILWNSPFLSNVNLRDGLYKGYMRHIDWNRGTPHVWKEPDFNELITTDDLFARKFSMDSMNLVNLLKQHIKTT